MQTAARETDDPETTTPNVVVLVGYMGSGKSTVGRELARLLGWRFTDLDHEIERRAGKSVAGIFSDSGESGFRALERECLRSALGELDAGRVVSCGGGAVVSPENRALLRGVPTVFLKEDVGVLYSRTRGDERPLRGVGRVEFEERYAVREPFYFEVAGYTVVVGGRSQAEVAKEVGAWLAR